MRAIASSCLTISKRRSCLVRCRTAWPGDNWGATAMPAEPVDRDVQFRALAAEQREVLMIQVAKRYYELDMTMGDLAKELGLTRWQASRLLTDARESGIVRIEIVPRAPRNPDLESRL